MEIVQRLLMVPKTLDAKLIEVAKAQKVSVQALLLNDAAEKYGIEIVVRKRGQRGPGKKKPSQPRG